MAIEKKSLISSRTAAKKAVIARGLESKMEPAPKAAPVVNATLRPAPFKVGPMRSGPMKSGPMKSGPMKSGPMKSGPMKSGPLKVY